MAIPRKGSRSIEVNGIAYRWRIRRRPTYSQGVLDSGLILAVDVDDAPQCSLIVEFTRSHPGNWVNQPTAPVTPRDVAEAIRRALAAGWQPFKPGKPFRLDADTEEGTPSDS